MPVDRVPHASHRSNPLPKGRYSIPQGLPPAYGVYELFDWSSTKNATSPSPGSSSASNSTFQRHFQKRKAESPPMQSWLNKQEFHNSPDIDSFSISTSSQKPLLFAPTRLPIPASSAPRHSTRHANRSFDERYAEDSEVEVLGDPDEEAMDYPPNGHDYEDDESDAESAFNVAPSDSGRTRDSRYIDHSAEVKRETPRPALLEESKWT
ncbi:hypothetical protein FRC09_013831 [Ceratobasidium sp. 395]|nr:hypothetical protein FRC09_013831 [Ceratobasidium sp. 395]